MVDKKWLIGVFNLRSLSDRFVNFHECFWEKYGVNYKNLVDGVREALNDIPTHNQYFTDHGPQHSGRVIRNVALICDKGEIDLNPVEKYILASAAWLHDIGMSVNTKINLSKIGIEEQPEWFEEIGTDSEETKTIDDGDLIRKWHHILSWAFIQKNIGNLGFPNQFVANSVAEVCRVHRRNTNINSVKRREVININNCEEEIHLRAIAALFQLSDALDTAKDRAPEIRFLTQQFPSESERHWKVCRLINGFEFDTEKNLIRFRASHSTPQEKELLEDKLLDLYEEYMNVNYVLGAKPYDLLLLDIRCLSDYKKQIGATVELSGKEIYIEDNTEESDQMHEFHSGKFKDIKSVWEISILNSRGDANIKREIQMEFLEPKGSRRHLARCFDSGMRWKWGTDIKAYDESGRNLGIRKKRDRPNAKEFEVIFPDSINTNEEYRYCYEYKWDRHFPEDNEIFILTDNSLREEATIEVATSMNIVEIWCEEIQQDGTRLADSESTLEKNSDSFTYSVEKGNPANDIELNWKVK